MNAPVINLREAVPDFQRHMDWIIANRGTYFDFWREDVPSTFYRASTVKEAREAIDDMFTHPEDFPEHFPEDAA